MSKKIERFYKVQIQKRASKEISAVEPFFYRHRFLESIKMKLNFNQERNKKKTLWDMFYKLERYHEQKSRTNSAGQSINQFVDDLDDIYNDDYIIMPSFPNVTTESRQQNESMEQ